MIFNIRNFPKYCDEYFNDGLSWDAGLRKNGYPSARESISHIPSMIMMDDEEYTWFVVKWS
jgi:hypothetical protein